MPGAAGANCKSEGTSSPASSSGRALQNEQEKSTLSRDLTVGLNKEKFLAKGNIKYASVAIYTDLFQYGITTRL